MENKNITDHSKLVNSNVIRTPDISHAKNNDWNYVYEPAEDTFLLLDALEKDLNFIRSQKPRIILEVGSGSGIIITALSQVLSSTVHCIAVDINKHACSLTKSTSIQNSCLVDVIEADLTSSLKNYSVDMIIFNPPYVVTSSDEVNSNDLLTKSWAGGVGGTEVIYRFLQLLNMILDEKGFGYLLVLKENNSQEIMKTLKRQNFGSKIIMERKLRGEELFVIKFMK